MVDVSTSIKWGYVVGRRPYRPHSKQETVPKVGQILKRLAI